MSEAVEALSEREMEVLSLLATGATNQEIARALVISPNTVKVHLRNIYEKLGVQSRTEASMEAVRRGWVPMAGAAAAPLAEKAAGMPETAEMRREARRPAEGWQRAYLAVVGILVLAMLAAPAWRLTVRQAPRATPFSDAGQPERAPVVRTDVARWTGQAALPQPRSRMAVVGDGALVYAIGGEVATGVTGQVEIFDPANNGWLAGAAKPTPVSNVAAVVLDGQVYVPGGTTSTGAVTNVLEAYDLASGAWEARSPLPEALAGYALAALNGKMYLFGGWDGAAYRADTYAYDPSSDRWSKGTPMPSVRAFSAASALGETIYVVGGYDGERELDIAEAYDPAGEGAPSGPWSSRTPMIAARGGLGLASIGSRLYAVGGGWTAPLAFNEHYDARTGAWTRFDTPVLREWRNLGLVAQVHRLYAIGGWGGGYLSLNESYQALLRQLLPLGSKG